MEWREWNPDLESLHSHHGLLTGQLAFLRKVKILESVMEDTLNNFFFKFAQAGGAGGGVGNLGSFGFFIYFLSLWQQLRPISYCAPHLNNCFPIKCDPVKKSASALQTHVFRIAVKYVTTQKTVLIF